MTHAVNLLLQKIKLCSFANLISQKFSDVHSGNIGYSSVQALHSRLASCECARLEYWIFVYLPFGHSSKFFSKNTFSVQQLTLGYHFQLTSSLPRHFQASKKLWNKMLSGAPNDGSLLNALKTLFTLSKVLLDLQKYILIGAIKFISVESSHRAT